MGGDPANAENCVGGKYYPTTFAPYLLNPVFKNRAKNRAAKNEVFHQKLRRGYFKNRTKNRATVFQKNHAKNRAVAKEKN